MGDAERGEYKPERSPRRTRALLLALLALLLLLFYLLRGVSLYLSLLTPVWGAVVQPEWVVVRGSKPVALVTLAIPDVRHATFREISLQEKATYARKHGYWFIACSQSLDTARPPVWSKLRLIAAVLEQVAPTVLWLDLDTIVWARHEGVEGLLEASPGSDLLAQHDFHRFHVYFNAGVMLLRKSEWTSWLLETAYNTRRTMLLRRLVYSMEEQDALNFVAAHSMRRPRGTPGRALGYKVRYFTYPRLWAFVHEAMEEDGSIAEGMLALHFPNCKEGRCTADFVRHAEIALKEDVVAFRSRSAAKPGAVRRTFPADMPLMTSWFNRR